MSKFRILAISFILSAFCMSGCFSQADTAKADRLALLSQKSRDAAIGLYTKRLQRDPRGPRSDDIRLKLAKLYMGSGDYVKAIEQLKIIPSRPAQVLLAQALFKNGDFTDALEVFNKIGDKGDAPYLYSYGLALEKNNLYDQAQRIYGAIKGNPVFEAKARERLAGIALGSGQGAFAGVDESVKKAIRESPGQDKYPEASGLYLLSDEKMELTADNRLVSDMHYVIKVLNDRGKEKFAEVTLNYDSTYEKLELEYARTIKPDGTVVTVGDKNIRDVSLYLNFPLYSNARVRIISMPEVAAGSVIEYRARIYRSQLPNKKDFDTTYWLAADEPILLEKCTIKIPRDRNLKYKVINPVYNTLGFDMAPKITEDKTSRFFSLEFKNVPQIIPEPLMPPLSRIDPYILFSTFESWRDVYSWWRDLYKDKAMPDEDIRAKVQELIKDKKAREEKIRAIYNFCAQEIRYVGVEYGEAGYEPHKASEIFRNKYGDCKDKAILLIAMLSAADIEAFPVLISTFDSFDMQEDLPALLFNHAIAVAKSGERLIFMDSTGSTVSFSDLPAQDQDRSTLVFFKDHYEFIRTPLFEPQHNTLFTRMKIKVNPDETMEGERQVEAGGVYEQSQRYWLKFTMPVLIEQTLKGKARSIADSAVLKDYEIKNVDDLDKPVLLKYRFNAPRYFVKAGKARIMDQLGSFDASGVVKESRAYPIEYAGLDHQEDAIEVELPGHIAVKYLPKPVVMDTKWFSFVCKYDVKDRHVIHFSWSDTSKERTIPVGEYPAYKKAVEDAASSVNQQVVLEEVK